MKDDVKLGKTLLMYIMQEVFVLLVNASFQPLTPLKRKRWLWSNEGDTILTPFLGIGSEVYQAIKLNRFGVGFELKESYFNEAIKNCRAMVAEKGYKSLFDEV